MENHTAKHFVLQLSSLVFLYLSLSFLVVLAFGIINILHPDAANGVWETEAAVSSVRVGIAVLIVFFPAYLVVTRIVNKLRRDSATGSYLSLTKWLIYLSLLIGGGVLLGDLAVVVMTFLEGEITQRFVLKAATVLVVVGAAFHYYILDARGFWMKNEEKSILYAVGAIFVVLAALAFGFTKIDTPNSVREQKLDERQIEDLRMIQNAVQQYYYLNTSVPNTLEEIATIGTIPTAPEGRADYRYNKTEKGFELCATFTEDSMPGRYTDYYNVPVEKGTILNSENWQHKTGEVCFERVINQLPN
jgi:type II secretory pathway pseudopilin PulG